MRIRQPENIPSSHRSRAVIRGSNEQEDAMSRPAPSLGHLIVMACALASQAPAFGSEQHVLGKDISLHASSVVAEEDRSIWFDASEVSADLVLSGDPVVSGGTLQFVLEESDPGSQPRYFAYDLPARSLSDGTSLWSYFAAENVSGFDYEDQGLEHGPVRVFRIRKRESGQLNIYSELSGEGAAQPLDLNYTGELDSVYVVFTAHGADPSDSQPDPGGRTCIQFLREESIACEDDGGTALYSTKDCHGAALAAVMERSKGCPAPRDPCEESPFRGAECQAFYTSPDGSDENEGSASEPFRTIAYAASQLADGDALMVQAGLYPESQRILLSESNIAIIGDGKPLIDASAYDLKDTQTDSWELHQVDLGIYRSKESFEIEDPSIAFHYVAASFDFRGEHHKFVSFPCYGALASGHSEYFSSDKSACTMENGSGQEDAGKSVYNFECSRREGAESDSEALDSAGFDYVDPNYSHCPYIGPGVYWDRDGLVDSSAPGRLYLRLGTSTPQIDFLDPLGERFAALPSDPNHLAIRASLQGTQLYQESLGLENIHVTGLKLVHGAIRVGGDSTNATFHDIELDGTTSDNAVEIYSGASFVTLDELTIDDLLPEWVTWDDVKTIYKDQLMNHGISFNKAANGDEVIHDVSITNSTIRNIHDAVEMVGDAYHHFEISNNLFEDIQDDVVQLGTATYDIDIHRNTMVEVGTSVSKQGQGGEENQKRGTKYIHHNVIDVSEKKLFCRLQAGTGDYKSSSCDEDGAFSRDAFASHDPGSTGSYGDPRYIYNNTIVLNGGEVSYGFKGEHVNSEGSPFFGRYPFGVPSLVFNNIFIQKDPEAPITRSSPNWHRLYQPYWTEAPPEPGEGPVLIADGNVYYRMQDSDDPVFYVSGATCDLAAFQSGFCNQGDTKFWDLNAPIDDLSRSWQVEGKALYGNPALNEDYEPTNCDLMQSLDAVDLSFITEDYRVSKDGGAEGFDPWDLELVDAALPGVDGAYRGAYDSCSEQATPVPEAPASWLLVAGIAALRSFDKRRGRRNR